MAINGLGQQQWEINKFNVAGFKKILICELVQDRKTQHLARNYNTGAGCSKAV